jgi:hypothetical protein
MFFWFDKIPKIKIHTKCLHAAKNKGKIIELLIHTLSDKNTSRNNNKKIKK